MSCGGPNESMVVPSALMGWTAFSPASTKPAANRTPSISLISETRSMSRASGSPKSLTGRADLEVRAGGDVARQIAERRAKPVGQDEAGHNEADSEHHREGGANCDARHLEDHGEFEGGLTRRLARQLVADAKVMSIRAVVRRHGLNWHLIQDLVDVWSALVAEHRRSRRCRVLLVDETSMRKRHRYVTVIQNGDTGQVLAMVEHRNAAAS